MTTDRFDERLADAALVWTGVVEQVFAHAAVVRPDRDGEALTLLHPSRGLLPHGLQVPWTRLQPREGERVRLGGRRLWLVDRWNRGRSVALVGAGVSLKLQARGELCRETLAQQLEGLRLPARTRTLLDGEPMPPGAVARAEAERLGTALSRLAVAIVRHDCAALQAAAQRLVGLGSGSTPSGDDLLVGCAAALRAFNAAGWVATEVLDELNRALNDVDPTSTTEVGRAMMAQAGQGAFAEPLLDVVRMLGRPDGSPARLDRAMTALAELGQHSGAEMLAGVVAVAHALWIQDQGGVR